MREAHSQLRRRLLERYHIECIHTADAEFDGPKLKKTWRNKTPKDAYDVLKSNDIQVTN